jgi:hypothetical protein
MTGRRSSVVCRTVRMTFVASLRIRSVAESNVAGRSAETNYRKRSRLEFRLRRCIAVRPPATCTYTI